MRRFIRLARMSRYAVVRGVCAMVGEPVEAGWLRDVKARARASGGYSRTTRGVLRLGCLRFSFFVVRVCVRVRVCASY